jgi:hypothetical protein
VPRGAWPYDGEIDLGYGAGLRMAATIVADDPLFGLIAYGGTLGAGERDLSVVPRDGLRQRFAVMLSSGRLRLELDRDGFTAGSPVVVSRTLRRVTFTLENRSADPHVCGLRLAPPGGGTGWRVMVNGRRVAVHASGDAEYPLHVDVPIAGDATRVEIAGR